MQQTLHLKQAYINKANAFLGLCKIRVVMLMLLSALTGMLLAQQSYDGKLMLLGLIGIALCASASAVINHIVDQNIDPIMRRTENRPLVLATVSNHEACTFAAILAALGLGTLYFYSNTLAMIMTFFSMIGYAFIYSVLLKHHTSQNIVIGGLSGALPPLLGWTAITGHLDPQAWILVMIIFAWTPPHFWALAIAHHDDYKKSGLPMLTVTHGIPYTQQQIFLYSILTSLTSLLPFAVQLSGFFYLLAMIPLNIFWLYRSWQLLYSIRFAKRFFFDSIGYLTALNFLMIIDHCWQ
jgi:heme o synthase